MWETCQGKNLLPPLLLSPPRLQTFVLQIYDLSVYDREVRSILGKAERGQKDRQSQKTLSHTATHKHARAHTHTSTHTCAHTHTLLSAWQMIICHHPRLTDSAAMPTSPPLQYGDRQTTAGTSLLPACHCLTFPMGSLQVRKTNRTGLNQVESNRTIPPVPGLSLMPNCPPTADGARQLSRNSGYSNFHFSDRRNDFPSVFAAKLKLRVHY